MSAFQSLPSERLRIAMATLCPACWTEMTETHVTDSKGHAVRTFQCPECPRPLEKTVKPTDSKAALVKGWLGSNLHAPK